MRNNRAVVGSFPVPVGVVVLLEPLISDEDGLTVNVRVGVAVLAGIATGDAICLGGHRRAALRR